ncbi:MAG: rRNA cytosine-C5-methyltransferase [Prevotellaceae bacterium]|jgi:NOL1/NOP2/sun family putative RNA methylase|nr:rRNA cytosine-C5-methyltransferase [Prevotellaceae bacterium]
MKLPEPFERSTKLLLKDEYSDFIKALITPSPTSIRLNDKIDFTPSDQQVPWYGKGYYLAERPLFTADPLFHAGAYYVQEASSMFLQQAVEQHFADAQCVLDLCAAPGGKATLIAQQLEKNAILVSNDIVRSRANVLAENLCKWGNENTIVTNNCPKDFGRFGGLFDAIVIDAPCSGEGMFRKDAEAVGQWSELKVKRCAERQKEIVASVWDALKEDGVLVYSTCTYNTVENEENIQWLTQHFEAEILSIQIDAKWGIVENEYGYRFYPHRLKGEGFFMAVLRKKERTNVLPPTKKKKVKDEKTGVEIHTMPLVRQEKYTVRRIDCFVYAFDKERVDTFLFFNERFNCLKTGLLLGEIKGKDIVPSAELALSKALDRSGVDCISLEKEDALRFLRKETVVQPAPLKKGYCLAKYHNTGLGWLKNVGNRFNNLYPQYWKIKMNIKT